MSAVAWLREQEQKELLRLVTIGSVDDGKSTLIGRLLHDAHGVYVDQLDAVRRASAKGSTRGAGSTSEIDFSLFTDGLAAEREQGITIETNCTLLNRTQQFQFMFRYRTPNIGTLFQDIDHVCLYSSFRLFVTR